jgi:hypothetical protein
MGGGEYAWLLGRLQVGSGGGGPCRTSERGARRVSLLSPRRDQGRSTRVSVFKLPDRSVEVYGMRRAFAAPPHPFRNEFVLTLSAFAAKEDQNADVWMISPDGSGAVNLTAESHAKDGLVDGSNLRNLTSHPARETFSGLFTARRPDCLHLGSGRESRGPLRGITTVPRRVPSQRRPPRRERALHRG